MWPGLARFPLPCSPLLWLLGYRSRFSSPFSSSASFASLSGFPGDTSAPFVCCLTPLSIFPSHTLVCTIGLQTQLRAWVCTLQSLIAIQLLNRLCERPWGSSYCMRPKVISVFSLPSPDPSLCSLLWLMRQKVSVPFISESQSRGILAGNFGCVSHRSARKYPLWASLKS